MNYSKKLEEYLFSREGVPVSVSELSKTFNLSKSGILEYAESISEAYKEYQILYSRKAGKIVLTRRGTSLEGYCLIEERIKRFLIGLYAEPQIGNKYSSLNLLHSAYSIFDQEDVNLIICAGGMFVGKPNRWNSDDVIIKTPEEQLAFARDVYPRSSLKLKTHVVAAEQDIWYSGSTRGRINLPSELSKLRWDIDYDGFREKDYPILEDTTDVVIRVMNPVTYERRSVGKTYEIQRIIEETQPIKGKKLIVVVGGFHTFAQIPPCYGVEEALLLPSLIPQTSVLRRKMINPTVGVVIIELLFTKKGESGKRQLKGIRTHFYPLDRYVKERDYFEFPKLGELPTLERRILKFLSRKEEVTKGMVSRKFKISKEYVDEVIDRLKRLGFDIHYEKKKIRFKPKLVRSFELKDEVSIKEDKIFRFVAISDTHLNHRWEHGLNALNDVFKRAKERGVKLVLHCGDLVEGIGRGYRGHLRNIVIDDASALVEYLKDVLPEEIRTYVIAGQHDQWIYKDVGMDIVAELCKQKQNWKYVGRFHGVVNEDISIALFHPEKGAPETLGYDPVKFSKMLKDLEAHFGKECKLLLLGNHHKALMIIVGGRICYLVPNLKARDKFLTDKGKVYFTGAWYGELKMKGKEIVRVTSEYWNYKGKIKVDSPDIYRWLAKYFEKELSKIEF